VTEGGRYWPQKTNLPNRGTRGDSVVFSGPRERERPFSKTLLLRDEVGETQLLGDSAGRKLMEQDKEDG
jgi:hypothetical protein